VYLFGSAARAETGPDSDLDFLVIETTVEDRAREAVRLRRAVGDVGMPVDVIVLDSATAARGARVPGTMVHHALTDGRLVGKP
jgi:predicted nucleotidyltransferase